MLPARVDVSGMCQSINASLLLRWRKLLWAWRVGCFSDFLFEGGTVVVRRSEGQVVLVFCGVEEGPWPIGHLPRLA